MNSNDLKSRTVTINRTFNAPVQLVWEAWTKPEHIAQWWGPKGMEIEVIYHEFKVGGKWQYEMLMPDGNKFISDGEYKAIKELKEILSLANFKPMTEGVEIQSIFEKDGNKTKFTFNVIHATEEYCKQQTEMGLLQGWGSAFDRLEAFVSKK